MPEGEDPESPAEQTYVSWSPGGSDDPPLAKKFWLSAASVDALRESIKGRGATLRFEVARYPAEAPETTPEPVYANYHAAADVAMEALLDPGCVTCAPERAFLKAPEYGAQSCLPVPAACRTAPPRTATSPPCPRARWRGRLRRRRRASRLPSR